MTTFCYVRTCNADDEAETGREKNIVSKFLLASLSTVDTAK